jgi:hypothetical protein
MLVGFVGLAPSAVGMTSWPSPHTSRTSSMPSSWMITTCGDGRSKGSESFLAGLGAVGGSFLPGAIMMEGPCRLGVEGRCPGPRTFFRNSIILLSTASHSRSRSSAVVFGSLSHLREGVLFSGGDTLVGPSTILRSSGIPSE